MIKTLFVSSLTLCLFSTGFCFAEDGCTTCTCCGCDTVIGELVTNAVLASCSSNCVRLTPEKCMQLKAEMGTYLDYVTNNAQSAISTINDLETYCSQLRSSLSAIKSDLDNVISIANDLNSSNQTAVADSIARLTSIRSNLITWTNQVSRVDGDGLTVIYSNVSTHVSTRLTGTGRITHRVRYLLPNLDSCISSLQTFGMLDITLLQDLRDEIDTLLGTSSGNMSGPIYDIEMTVSYYQSELYGIRDNGIALADTLESFDCEPCGRGGGSSDGGGTTIDFTPIIEEIRLLKERLDYHLNRLYNLLQRYFNDYNSATDRPVISRTDLSSLASNRNYFSRIEALLFNAADLPDKFYTDYDAASSTVPDYSPDDYGSAESANNWFIRVEQLLGMIANPKKDGGDVVGDDLPTDPPEKMETNTNVTALAEGSERAETSANTQKTDFDNALNGGWNTVKSSLQRFANALRGLGQQETNIDGMSLELTIETEGGTKDLFQIPEGTSARLSIVRSVCNVVWVLLCSFLYIYAFKFFFGLILSYIAWFLKLSSATFGG